MPLCRPKTIYPNATTAAADATSGIANTTGVYDYSNSPNPILKTNPTPEEESGPTYEAEPDNEHEDDDDGEDYDYYNEKVKEL